MQLIINSQYTNEQKYGLKIKRIKSECLAHGVVEPKFEEFVHGFRGTPTQKNRRKQILELLKENSKLTRDILVEIIIVFSNFIKQHLSKLQNDKLLKRVSEREDGYWKFWMLNKKISVKNEVRLNFKWIEKTNAIGIKNCTKDLV